MTTILLESGIVEMKAPETRIKIDTPAGLVRCYGLVEDDRVRTVFFENVFHQRQAKPGAALHPALTDIDAIKPFGQAWQMFRRNTGAKISHRDANFGSAIRGLRLRDTNLDLAAGRAVFQRILHEIFEQTE